jgi:nicotinamidase-related amidase/type 1 glutamine amidotransferase
MGCMSVAFRSLKKHPFAEQKATIDAAWTLSFRRITLPGGIQFLQTVTTVGGPAMRRILTRWRAIPSLAIWAIAFLCCHGWCVALAQDNTLQLTLRSRTASDQLSESFRVHFKTAEWRTDQTAVIICDMWDNHWCPTSAKRVVEIAPRINDFVAACRQRGVTIIHAPSDCMEFYAAHPARIRAGGIAKIANLPDEIDAWCKSIPAEEKGKYPIDQTDGGCDAENPPKSYKAWSRQIEAIQIDGGRDFISASGSEIWSILDRRDIKNVMLCGVHTNMCVLGRPFGLRNMSRFGKNTVLVRDLTDTMYNPKAWPYVNHFRGTQLIVEHIEKYVAATITSDQVLGDAPFRFKEDERPRIVFAISEPEYKTHETLPVFAAEHLETRLGYDCAAIQGDPQKHTIPSLARALADADLLVVSIRRQALRKSDLTAIRAHLAAGKPLVGIRTASHAFDARGKGADGSEQWPTFDPDVLGGHYTGHHGKTDAVEVSLAEGASGHAILKDVSLPFSSGGSLYKTKPLAKSTTPLLFGTIPVADPEPVAWTNTHGESRIFYTSLGHEDDFNNKSFVRLLTNAIEWCLAK